MSDIWRVGPHGGRGTTVSRGTDRNRAGGWPGLAADDARQTATHARDRTTRNLGP